MKNTNIFILTTQDTVPASKAATGTVASSDSRLIGTGTLFTTELRPNDWIYIKTQNAIRRVINISSDTELTLDEPFGVALAGATYRITPASQLKEISGIVDVGTATIDGVAFANGDGFEFNKNNREASWSKDFIDPIDIVPIGVGARVRITTTS